MERRTASHTEEEELNQRRRLLNLARKGDPKAINRLFELYQVRVYTGDALSRTGRLPLWPTVHPKPGKSVRRKRAMRRPSRRVRRHTRARARAARRISRKKPARRARRR